MNQFCHAFISYGRADSKAFATKLHTRLLEQGLKVWFDQNDIPLGVDFQNQIDDGLEKAHNFLFLIAPHSVNSVYCLKEIELALKRNKRIIPLLHVEQISRETWQQRFPTGKDEEWEAYKEKGKHTVFQNMHPTIGKINWVYFREGIDDFEASFTGLINLLYSHADYVEQHTRFLAKALEWERHQKQTSCLLIGEERQQAESWFKIRFKNEQPPCIPTDLHCEYITESIKNANNLMTQVFLSYAEEDRETMEKIRNSLRRESITVWTNKTDIQTGEAFDEAIKRGIEQADNVVYLLSPNSVNSNYCQRELDLAVSLHKRIIPLLVRETGSNQIPSALRSLQYIDLTDNVKEDDYLLDESQLLKILHQDAAYYNEHKVLLTKALKWKRQHENPSVLLRGYNLRSAETWLKVAQKRIQHPPTPLQEEFIAESLRQPPLSSLDVFISYSRADSDFARKLNDSLQMQGKTTWFDQESIASGSDFQQEIYRGIKACDNFLFILSPRSVSSPYCADEVEYAASLNKRFVTLLHREVNSADLHLELAKVQWIDFNQNQRDFNANFNKLVRTLDTDREHVHSHTKWLQRAIEWDSKGQSADLLLRGSEFLIARNWLQETEQQKKQPAATVLQKALIEASQNAIVAAEESEKRRQAEMLRLQEERTKEVEARLAEQKKSAKRQKFFLAAVSIALVAAVGVSVVAVNERKKAEAAQEGSINSVSRFSLALSEADLKFDALIEAIRAEGQLQKESHIKSDSPIQSRVVRALQAAVYGNGFRERNRLSGHTNRVTSVSFSPNGKTIATASWDKTVKLWSVEGKPLSTLEGHTDVVNSVSFSPDGKTIATASDDRTVKLWSVGGKPLSTLEGHNDVVNSVSFSPDGKTIATASDDKTVKLWSVQGKQLSTLEGHTDVVNSVSFSPDGKTLATASDDRTVKLWSVEGKPLSTLNGHTDAVSSVSFSPDGKTIATASADKTVKLWSVQGKELSTLKGHTDQVKSVSFGPDGKTLATASDDKTVKLWNLQGKQLPTLKGHTDEVRSVSFSPDGKTIATASWDKTVKLWNLEGEQLSTLKHTNRVKSVSFSPDGKTIATASWDKTVKLWNLEGKELSTLEGHNDVVNSVSFSSDGKTIATASWDKTVKLWNLEGKELSTLEGHTDVVNSVSFSPDGKTLATASDDRTAKLWNLEGKELSTLKGHTAKVYSVSFSPDGKTLATASDDKTAKLWSLEGKQLSTLNGHTDSVYSVSFSPDGKTLASASSDGSVILWKLEDLRPNKNKLMQDACAWVRDYLKYNSRVDKSDKQLCDGISTQK
ncbi:MAG TPA: TIR domain-containing protein [Waterburya sp.]